MREAVRISISITSSRLLIGYPSSYSFRNLLVVTIISNMHRAYVKRSVKLKIQENIMEQKLLNDSTNTKIPVYTKNWFVILMLRIFFPVGLWLMVAYKKNWNMIVKLLITAFFAYCFIVSIASYSKPNNSIDTDMSSQSSCADNIVTDNQLNEDLSKTTTLSHD